MPKPTKSNKYAPYGIESPTDSKVTLNKSECNHLFWREGEPKGCFNCGKTKKEISGDSSRIDKLEKAVRQLADFMYLSLKSDIVYDQINDILNSKE